MINPASDIIVGTAVIPADASPEVMLVCSVWDGVVSEAPAEMSSVMVGLVALPSETELLVVVGDTVVGEVRAELSMVLVLALVLVVSLETMPVWDV